MQIFIIVGKKWVQGYSFWATVGNGIKENKQWQN